MFKNLYQTTLKKQKLYYFLIYWKFINKTYINF